jgi:excisionase family DNA binding protein
MQYYTLEQAAQLLRTTPDKLREMAKRNEVRAFQDRGSLRFRAQEIEELARSLGLGSDTDISINVAGPSGGKLGGGGTPPSGGPRTPGSSARPTRTAPADHGARNMGLDDSDSDEVPIGAEPRSDRGSHPSSSGRRSPSKPSSKSPPPKPASDSDVRLVMEGSDLDFTIDMGPSSKIVKGGGAPGSSPRTRPTETGKTGSSARKIPAAQQSDSDVKVGGAGVEEVTLDEGGKPKVPSDSDVRLEGQEGDLPAGGRKQENVTEEIDLDAEQAAVKPRSPAPRPRASGTVPTATPPEVSLSGGRTNAPTTESPAAKAPAGKPPPSKSTESSDFELSLDSSPVELGSDELPAKTGSDDEVDLGGLANVGPGATGINLKEPADSGISLEEGGSDEIEFELSLDATSESLPPSSRKMAEESSSSSSEFDLNLDVESSSEVVLESPKGDPNKASEFELTLDDEGGLAPLEGESGEHGQKEIFETDFDVPAADESGGEAVLEESDTDLESSDFDLHLEESGSEAVALDEAEAEDEAAQEAGFEEGLEGEPEEEEVEEPVAAAAPAAQPWGALPVVFLVPSVIILFIVTLMSFEMARGMWGYHQPGKASSVILNPFARMLDDDPMFKD